jgi:FtsH-binding integral membrane protein
MAKNTIEMEYRANAAQAKTVGNEGLKAYIRKVFGYMGISLGLTSLVSYLMLRTSLWTALFNPATGSYSGLGWAIVWAPLAIILFMSFSRSLTSTGSKVALFGISALEGASLSLLILGAGVHNAFQAFLITGAIFGAMSLYGHTTNSDLTRMGSLLLMGLLGLIVVSVVGMFTGGVGIWFSYLTVLVFTGLIAYEMQQIRHIYEATGGRGRDADKLAVMCALSLYLDFLNIFVALLRILNSSGRN